MSAAVPTSEDHDGAAANGDNAIVTVGKENEIEIKEKVFMPRLKRVIKDGKLTFVPEKVIRPTEDISNDGGLLRKVLNYGGYWTNPKDPDLVSVKYEARLDDGTLVASASDGGVEFIVRDGHFCPGLSKAVKTMCTGDRVLDCHLPGLARKP